MKPREVKRATKEILMKKFILLALLGLTLASVKAAENPFDLNTVYGDSTLVTGLRIRRARGHDGAKERLFVGDNIIGIEGTGFTGTAFSTNIAAGIYMKSTETWSATANGTAITIWATKASTATPLEQAIFYDRALFFDANTTTPSAKTGYASIQAVSSLGVAELKAMDDAGNITLLSPHDPITNDWVFYSVNQKTGRTVRVNMEEFFKYFDDKFKTHFFQESSTNDLSR